ncbi:MAG: biotin--[acetyl-CoA-carboxylase] ligase [Bacteroidota bacterium]
MIGHKIFEFDRVDSTNAVADQVFQERDPAGGEVVWAHDQYAGRGQHDHTWESEPGKNLSFTVILRPRFLAPHRQFLLNKAVALAVADFVTDALRKVSHPPVSVKWPNDIYIGDNKAAGILIENKIMGSKLDTSLVGIGINVNQLVFPPEIPNPVSLITFLRLETDLREMLLAVCRHLDARYSALQDPGRGNLDEDYDSRLLGFEQWRNYTFRGRISKGKIKGVNLTGQLVIETITGATLSFDHGEVGFVL